MLRFHLPLRRGRDVGADAVDGVGDEGADAGEHEEEEEREELGEEGHNFREAVVGLGWWLSAA